MFAESLSPPVLGNTWEDGLKIQPEFYSVLKFVGKTSGPLPPPSPSPPRGPTLTRTLVSAEATRIKWAGTRSERDLRREGTTMGLFTVGEKWSLWGSFGG